MSKPEANIAELPAAFRFRPQPPISLTRCSSSRKSIRTFGLRRAANFETVAAAHRALADGAAKIARILTGGKRG